MQDALADRLSEVLDSVTRSHVSEESLPCLVAGFDLAGDERVVVAGRLEPGGRPARRDSLFRIASTSKPVLAAATLRLAEEGLFTIDEPVARFLPELASPRVLTAFDAPLESTVPAERVITIRQLLNFTFGFGACLDMFMAPSPWPVCQAEAELGLRAFGPPAPESQPPPDEWIARFGSLPLLSQPGSSWMYNTGSAVLGVLLARATGESLGVLLERLLFDPLGMHDTAFFGSPERLATAYRKGPEGLELFDPPDGQWSRPPAFPDGAGGLVSSFDDLLRFGRMLLGRGGELLSSASRDEMARDELASLARTPTVEAILGERSWGLGGAVPAAPDRPGSYGWDGGFGTSFLVDPHRDLVLVGMTQTLFETAALPAVHRELRQGVLDALS